MATVRPAGTPGAYGDPVQIKKVFKNGTQDDNPPAIDASTLVLQPHPVWGTLAAEKFTEGMEPAKASVYPGQNGPAGVAGDFDKIYLPKPLVRKVHSGRPLMKGETKAKPADMHSSVSFHETVSEWPTEDLSEEKPYTVPKYAHDFPLETNMDPQRLHSGFMAAPAIPTATLPAKPTSPLPLNPKPVEFPEDSAIRKITLGALSDAPFHNTYTSESLEMSKKQTELIKSHAAGAVQGKRFTSKLI
mmetsp:Transcript_27782/g.81656  ORF Transcript_27782/g.81656 Transcript_27782/m.81656 type:complete len:245 (+) Transcript_27782:66-800(+)